jgi:hypothetical protein
MPRSPMQMPPLRNAALRGAAAEYERNPIPRMPPIHAPNRRTALLTTARRSTSLAATVRSALDARPCAHAPRTLTHGSNGENHNDPRRDPCATTAGRLARTLLWRARWARSGFSSRVHGRPVIREPRRALTRATQRSVSGNQPANTPRPARPREHARDREHVGDQPNARHPRVTRFAAITELHAYARSDHRIIRHSNPSRSYSSGRRRSSIPARLTRWPGPERCGRRRPEFRDL